MSQTDWLVRLPVFQGPLDLLLFLVRRAEVDIHDIEIHTLTDQYLGYVRHLSRVDIDVAGEFLVMAATLVEIKSRSLTPATPAEGDETGAAPAAGEDPKAELIRQLLAYQRFRTAAEGLDQRRREFNDRSAVRVRAGEAASAAMPVDGAAEALERVDAEQVDAEQADWELEDLHLGDLYSAFERIAASIDLSRIGDHKIEYDDTPISLHQEDLVDRLTRSDAHRLELPSVFEGRSHSERIGLFLAVLELVRQGRVRVKQDDLDDPIQLDLIEERDPNAPSF